jgi:hypothetical protein
LATGGFKTGDCKKLGRVRLMFIDVNRSGVARTQGQCGIYTRGNNFIYAHTVLPTLSTSAGPFIRSAIVLKGIQIILVTREEGLFSQVS